jgi:hypothetical protein
VRITETVGRDIEVVAASAAMSLEGVGEGGTPCLAGVMVRRGDHDATRPSSFNTHARTVVGFLR